MYNDQKIPVIKPYGDQNFQSPNLVAIEKN
jgi:hypothetical protein